MEEQTPEEIADEIEAIADQVHALLTPEEMRIRLAHVQALADLQQRTPEIRLID